MAHACIPLNSEGPSRGVLNVAARPGQHFSEEELHFLETLGRQVCLAVERARHLEAERWHDREARALGALNKAIGQSLDLQAVLGAVGHTAGEILKVGGVTIFLGSDPRELTVAHVTGSHAPPLAEGRTVDLGLPEATLVRRALLHQKVVRIDDWSLAERQGPIPAPGWERGSALLVPLVARKSVLGLLVLSREKPHRWGADQVEIAEALAAQASVSLENARLYENARRAYRDLSEAQARIIESEKLAVVGTFAAGLAHEIRNPLNSIALQLSILERRSAPLEISLAREIEDLLAVIREEVKRLDNLVGDFLKFSGSGRLQHRPASLDALVDEVMGLLEPEAGAAGVALDRRRPAVPLSDLPLDGEKIKQVLINLLQNAIEAQPEGGRVIVRNRLARRPGERGRRGPGARAAPGSRRVPALRHHQGPGHGPRARHRAADRPRSRGRDPRGKHTRGGRHLHDQPARGPRRERGDGVAMNTKGRVVVIDDEVNAAAALETLLREDGYQVARANDARSGLLLLEKEEPDVVLTDLRMPGMDGIELLTKIKQVRPETMVILMTAYGTVKTAVRAMKLGAEDYLGKPIDVEELEVILQKAIEKKGLLEETEAPAGTARAQVPLRQPGGREPGDARGLQGDPPGGALERLRPPPRGERHGQGALRPGPAPEQPALPQALRARGLRRPARDPAGERALRPRERAPSRAPSPPAPAASRRRTGAPSSWTRSATSRPPSRSSSFASWKSASSSEWGATRPTRWTCASWPPPTATSRRSWRTAASARTSTTA